MPKAIGSSAFSAFFFRALRASVRSGPEGKPSRFTRETAAFAAATLVQAAAHGALASSAGLLGQTLVSRQSGVALRFVDSLPLDFSPLRLCLLGFAAAVVKTGAGALAVYEQKRLTFRVGDSARREVTEAILRAGPASRSAAHTHAAIAVRLREVERGVDEGLLAALRAVANLVPLALALIVLSSRLALASFAVLAPFALILGLLRRRLRAAHGRASHLAEQLHAGVDELVRHLDLWRTYGAADRVRQALAEAGERAGRASARGDAAKAAISGGNEVLAALALLVAVLLVERGGIALDRGPLVAFAAVFFLMYRPLRDLGDARISIERGAHALLDLDRVRADVEGGTGGSTGQASVSTPRTGAWGVETLCVRELSVVRGDHATSPTSLNAFPGEVVALVGPTGAGKTSLLRALLGLERDTVGSIRYGDRDLTPAGVGPAERPFAWVPQEPAIVAGTLADNIALAAGESAPAADLAREALAAIGARSLVDRVGDVLAAGGPELSGGERQWVAIARALASGLPVLLLDEPTSGLDPMSQQRVLEALGAVRGKRTVILVTHRPEPLAIADRVIRLGEGEHVSRA
ncbi:MAG: ATP-binding cassette domain-containing protein [Minicystis sp.]